MFSRPYFASNKSLYSLSIPLDLNSLNIKTIQNITLSDCVSLVLTVVVALIAVVAVLVIIVVTGVELVMEVVI